VSLLNPDSGVSSRVNVVSVLLHVGIIATGLAATLATRQLVWVITAVVAAVIVGQAPKVAQQWERPLLDHPVC
jgi:hypothetical protein